VSTGGSAIVASHLRSLRPRRLGRPATTSAVLKFAPDTVAQELDGFFLDLCGGPCGPGFQHRETEQYLPLERIGDFEHRAPSDIGVGRQHLFDFAGREAMGGEIDYVVRPGHHAWM